MIFYDIASKNTIIEEHYESLVDYINNKINTSSLNSRLKSSIRNNLEDIIKGDPNKLNDLNQDFKSQNYKDTKRIKKKVADIFNYKYFSNKSSPYSAYDLAEKLKIRTCLYCNRNYTLTVKLGTRREDKITRPEFDHFFDKDENPLLSLSVQNLIPSCKTCNSSL